MPSNKKSYLVVNVLYWIIGALMYPLTSLLTNNEGETPKFYSLLIPIAFIGLAFGSTWMMSRAFGSNRP